MSDDFNSDDLDWLRDDGDDGDNSYSSDDDDLSLELDWLRDDDGDDDSPRTTDDSTGLTGQLDWQGSGDDESGGSPDESSTGVTGQLDWQGSGDDDKSGGASDETSTGVTGQLSWQGDGREEEFERQLDEAEAEAENIDASSFLGNSDDSDDSVPDVDTGDLSLPEWMQDVDISDELEDDLESLPADAPEWLSESDIVEDDLDGLPDDAPEWLSGTGSLTDDSVAQTPEWLADTGSLLDDTDVDDAPEWLSDTGSLVEDSISDDAPEWLSDTGALAQDSGFDEAGETIPDQGEVAVPDWLAGTGSLLSDDGDDDEDYETPDWLAGTGSLLADDSTPGPMLADAPDADVGVPDWLSGGDDFSGEDTPEPVLEDAPDADVGVPDWLSGGDDFATDDSAEPAFESDLMDDAPQTPDWLDEPVMSPESGDEIEFDAFDAFETGDEAFAETEAEAQVDDFSDLFGEDDFALETGAESEDFDLLGELTTESEEFDLLLQQEGDEESDSFNLLDELGVGEGTGLTGLLNEADSPADAITDDIFGDIDGDEEEIFAESPEPSATGVEMNTGELNALFGDDRDNDDLFSEPIAEVPDEALDDLFGEVEDEKEIFAESQEPSAAGVEMNTGELNALFGDDDEDERVDWFAEDDEGAAVSDSPDWLDDVDVNDFEPEPEITPSEDASVVVPGARYDNVDDYLSSFGDDKSLALPDTGMLESAAMDNDFDALFDTGIDEFADEEDEAQLEAQFDASTNPDRPDWLDDVNVNVGGTSASVALRGQKDSPIEELPDRLQALHERGRDMSVKRGEASPELQELLPEVKEVLPEADFGERQSAVTAPLNLSADQRSQINVLRNVVGGGTLAGLADSPFSDDLSDENVASRAGTSRRLLSGRALERFFIMLILALAVILPFVQDLDFLHIGELPPPTFDAGSEQQAFFNQIEALNPGDLVLVAAEYGPTGAAEMDPGTQAMFVHILSQGARPFIVSGNPVGLLHAHNLMTEIGDGFGFAENQEYFLGRYLVGDAIGLRAFEVNLQTITGTDSQGRPTNLDIESLDEFALLVVVTDRSDRLRQWAEQVASETTTPMIGITSNAASPLAQPYLQAENNTGTATGISGLLVGYRDAYTYLTMLGIPQESGASDGQILIETPDSTPEVEPTATETIAPSQTPLPTDDVATEEVVVPEPTATEDTVLPTETVAPTETEPPLPTDTPEPTGTEAPTRTQVPSNTPQPSLTPTPAVEMVRFGVVNASTSINVRSGPSTSDSVVSVLRPDTRVLIIGENEDASWYEVLLEDGTPGWVAEFLLNIEIEMVPIDDAEATPEAEEETEGNGKRRVVRNQDDDVTPEATAEIDESATTDDVQDTSADSDGEEIDENDGMLNFGFGNIDYRDERWYAMTLGLVAAIVIIFAGNILNVLRALRRRRRGES